MSRTALILAAHGSNHDPSVNAGIRRLAEHVAARHVFSEVAVGFHQGEPGFGEALNQIRSVDVIVVPVMTSEGHYSDTVLPDELARSRRFHQVRVRILPPLGVHPLIAELVQRRLAALCDRYGADAARVAVMIVGHGTPRHAGSRRATEQLTAAIRDRLPAATDVRAAFLDEPPGIEETAADLASTCELLCVMPFLIGAGYHAARDVPKRLGIDLSRGGPHEPPHETRLNGCHIVCDAAIGTDQGLAEIISELASAAMAQPTFPRPAGSNNGHPLRLGTRGSRLARWQAQHVAERLRELGTTVEIIELSTLGDRILDRPIAELPGDAPFTTDIEQALLDGKIDLAVHSFKDLPLDTDPGLVLAAILPRGSIGESLVSRSGRGLRDLLAGATVGTSSIRRIAQLLAVRPDLRPIPIRGAVEQRIAQVRMGRFDAAILATAGLERIDCLHEASESLSLDDFLPAPGQGAMVIQCRAADSGIIRAVAPLDDPATRFAVETEWSAYRAFVDRDEFAFAAFAVVAAHDHVVTTGGNTAVAPVTDSGRPIDASLGEWSIALTARLVARDGSTHHDVRVIGASPSDVAAMAVARLERFIVHTNGEDDRSVESLRTSEAAR